MGEKTIESILKENRVFQPPQAFSERGGDFWSRRRAAVEAETEQSAAEQARADAAAQDAALAPCAERKVILTAEWPTNPVGAEADDDLDPFTTVLPTAFVANKAELITELDDELDALRELTGYAYPTLTTSVETGMGLDRIGAWLFDRLGVVRVYTKIPGKPADMGRPFTVRRGQTVLDVAELVHRDIAASFKYARIWGEGSYDGQQVGRDHLVVDGDVVEIHS